MARSIYIASPTLGSGRTTVARALAAALTKVVGSVGVFRPFVPSDGPDTSLADLLAASGSSATAEQSTGVTWEAYHASPEEALTQIIEAYRALAASHDVVVIDGSGADDVVAASRLPLAGKVAANLGSPVLLVLPAASPARTAAAAKAAIAEISAEHATVTAVLANRCPADDAAAVSQALAALGVVGTTLPELADPADAAAAASAADAEALLEAIEAEPTGVVTPLMFQADLIDRARAWRRTIVLPEPDDDRVLRAADIVLRRGIADLILLGEEEAVRARAAELGLDIAAARVVSPHDAELVEKYAAEFARLRAKKGVTLEQAREKVQDVSYFGTMMVHMGDAHGMVSGAAHTTAHTIVPSFQIIKTRPGTAIVSSVFLMALADRVLVYGDCAVNPEPTAEELADIAVSSAATAAQFGITPRVAMLSFSTGTSGKGEAVDKVRTATELVRAKAPELAVEGPIQYDAAVDAAVAAKKAPGSAVAGKANVFIFPDLSAGNIGYKAVQRSSGAVAMGPVLQGLNKPVNDLSRGALVEDIVNTVAITAVQAQG